MQIGQLREKLSNMLSNMLSNLLRSLSSAVGVQIGQLRDKLSNMRTEFGDIVEGSLAKMHHRLALSFAQQSHCA